MAITNATLATAVNDLIAYWASFNEEYATWIGGTVGGGPNLDGNYPLTDYEGVTTLVACPAQLEDDVTNLVTGAAGHKAAAEVAQTAAEVAQAAAELAETGSEAARDAALAYRDAALAAQTAAESARTTAIAQAAVATANAAQTTLDAAATAQDAIDTAADAAAAAASAAAAATFDPVLYAALADAETITGAWTFNSNLTIASANLIMSAAKDQDILGYGGASIRLYDATLGGIVLDPSASFKVFIEGDLDLRGNGIQNLGGNLVVGSGWELDGHTGAFMRPYDGATGDFLIAASTAANTAIGDIKLQVGVTTPVTALEVRKSDGNVYITNDLAATGAVTGSNLNVANWDTAFSWGDHAGLYSLAAHNHAGVYEPADATILKDADIGVSVAALAGNTFTGNHTFNDGFTIGDSLGRVLVNDTGDSGTRLYMAGRNAGDTDWNWGAEHGWDQANQRWYFDDDVLIGGVLSGISSLLGTSFTFTDVGQVARFNIVGGTSGNTHFNWSSGGSNYISHKTGQFTLFRSYDGVSAYTDKVQIDDSKVLLTGMGIQTNHEGSKNFPVVYTTASASTTIRSGNYATWGNSYSQQASFMANNAYMDPADSLNQYRYMNTHATYGHAIYKQFNGQHQWYGDTASVTAGAIVSEQLLMYLHESSNVATLELGIASTTIGGQLSLHGTTANKTSELQCTNGNLHIDSADGSQVYLNYYSNTGGVYIGAAGGFKSVMTGQYGSVQTQGTTGGYGGVSLAGYFALMNSGSSHVGLYNDVNNEWFFLCYPNSYMQIYHNNVGVLRTTTTGLRHPSYGAYYHNNNSAYLGGKVHFSTGSATGGTSGDIWYQYT